MLCWLGATMLSHFPGEARYPCRLHYPNPGQHSQGKEYLVFFGSLSSPERRQRQHSGVPIASAGVMQITRTDRSCKFGHLSCN